MNQSVKSIRDTLKLGSGQLLTAIFIALYFIIITRTFTKLEVSSIAVLGILTGLASMSASLGLIPTCLQRIPFLLKQNAKGEAAGLLRLTFFAPQCISLLIAIAVFIYAENISQIFFKTTLYTNVIILISVGMVISRFYDTGLLLLGILDQFGKLTLVSLVNDILIRIIALPLYFYYGILAYLGTLILGQFLIGIYIFISLAPFLKFKSTVLNTKQIVLYSLPFYGYGFVRYASMNADQFLIGVFLLPDQLATYYVVRRFFDYIVNLIEALLGPVKPKFSAIKASGFEVMSMIFTKVSRYLSMALIPTCMFLAAFSYPLLQIYGGNKYIAGYPILILLCLTGIAYGIFSLHSMGIQVATSPSNTLWIESVSGLANLIMCYTLLRFSANLYSIAVARLCAVVIAAMFARSLLNIKLGRLKMDINSWLRIGIISLLCGLLAVFLQVMFYRIWVTPFYMFLVSVTFVYFLSRLLKTDEVELISNALPGKFSTLFRKIILLTHPAKAIVSS